MLIDSNRRLINPLIREIISKKHLIRRAPLGNIDHSLQFPFLRRAVVALYRALALPHHHQIRLRLLYILLARLIRYGRAAVFSQRQCLSVPQIGQVLPQTWFWATIRSICHSVFRHLIILITVPILILIYIENLKIGRLLEYLDVLRLLLGFERACRYLLGERIAIHLQLVGQLTFSGALKVRNTQDCTLFV